MAVDFSPMYAGIYKALFNVAMICFFIGLFTTGSTSLDCYNAGYSTFAVATMLILIKILYQIQSKKSDMGSIGSIALSIGPFAIILSVVICQIYFNMIYRNIIIEGHVSSGFSTFSNIVIVLLLIQIFVLLSVVSSDSFDEKGISSTTSGTILMLAILSAIATNIVRTILKYFTTDGFGSTIVKI
jgi:hypothetical protein